MKNIHLTNKKQKLIKKIVKEINLKSGILKHFLEVFSAIKEIDLKAHKNRT